MSLKVAEGNDIRFSHFSIEQGLSQSTVLEIAQGDHGFMWFGTHVGLNRFDGYTFKIYKHRIGEPGSLGGTYITALFKDRSGMLWIGVDQGADKFGPSTETFTHYRSNSNRSGISGSPLGICEDQLGALWFATTNGLDKLDPSTNSFTHYRHDSASAGSLDSDDVRAVFVDRNGTVWAATAAGLNALDPGARVFLHYHFFPESPGPREAGRMGIYQDRSGTLWLTSVMGNGLTSFDRRSGLVTRYEFQDTHTDNARATGVNAWLEDRNGTIWLGTVGGGIAKFDRKLGQVTRYRNDPNNPESLSNNFESALYQDLEGNIWVGSGGGGIDRFSDSPSPFLKYKHEPNRNSLDQSFVLSAYEDSHGILWVGTDSVLNRVDRRTGHVSFYRHRPGGPNSISSGSVVSTIEDERGVLWFGTYDGGLDRYDRRTGKFKVYRHDRQDAHSLSSDSIDKLFFDHRGTLWVATSAGLDRFDAKTERFTSYLMNPQDPPSIRAVAEDRSGALWLGTFDQGLYRFDPKTDDVVQFTQSSASPRTLTDNRVNSLLIDTSGMLWIGTQNGMNELNPDTQVLLSTYSEHDGLSNDAVQGILQDNRGYLWIGTTKGLSRFDPEKKSFRNYYESDGLAGDEFNFYGIAFKAADGEMFFGGVKGITAFYPDRVIDNTFVPPVVLTDFLLFNSPVTVGGKSPLKRSIFSTDGLTLDHKQSIFSFEFSALSFADPARNRYRYKLEGLETKWNETNSARRFVTYTTIMPGEYVFRVQGSNNRGVWNDDGVSLRIRILPPWWKTWWFRGIEAGFVLLIFWSVYYLRMRTVERRNHDLAIQVAQRTAAETEIRALSERLISAQEQERIRISQELHDHINQRIAALTLLIGSVRRRVPDMKSEAYRDLGAIRDELSELSTVVRALSHELHPAVLDYCDIAAVLRSQCKEFSALYGIEVALTSTGNFEDVPQEIALCVYRVTQEALQNVAKHAKVQRASVILERADNRVRAIVRDDGVGFNSDEVRTSGGLGLVSMKERVRFVNGILDVHSVPNEGTTLKIEIPVLARADTAAQVSGG